MDGVVVAAGLFLSVFKDGRDLVVGGSIQADTEEVLPCFLWVLVMRSVVSICGSWPVYQVHRFYLVSP